MAVGFLGWNVTQRKDLQNVETMTAVASSQPDLSLWAPRGGGALCSCHWLDTEGRNSILSLVYCCWATVAWTALLLLLPFLVWGLSESATKCLLDAATLLFKHRKFRSQKFLVSSPILATWKICKFFPAQHSISRPSNLAKPTKENHS